MSENRFTTGPLTVWEGHSDLYAGPISDNTEYGIIGEPHQPLVNVAQCDVDDEIDESEQIANAERLALCWNAHDRLVTLCKMLTKTLIQLAPYDSDVTEGVVAIVDIGKSTVEEFTDWQ